jgi:hypothetical protein
MADRKDRFALISKFEQNYKANNIIKPAINKYNEQWAADALLESFDYKDIILAMSYYFKINSNPTWRGFANNVDRLLQSIKTQEEDRIFREEMRLKAKEWVDG